MNQVLPLCFSSCEAYLVFDDFNLSSQSFYALTNCFFSTFFSRAVSWKISCFYNWYSKFLLPSFQCMFISVLSLFSVSVLLSHLLFPLILPCLKCLITPIYPLSHSICYPTVSLLILSLKLFHYCSVMSYN